MNNVHPIAAPPLSEERVRHIIREELEWALRLRNTETKTPKARGGRKPDLVRYRLIADKYEQGATILECATEFDCSMNMVQAALKTLGVPPRANKQRKGHYHYNPNTDEIIALREQGLTLEEIGERFRITRERVRQILNMAGVETDARSRPLNPDERAAVERYVAGDSLYAAAESIGIGHVRMRQLIRRGGHEVRPSRRTCKHMPRTLEMSAKAAELYAAGVKNKEIAEVLGLPKAEMVYRLLAIAGVKPNRQRRDHQITSKG